MEPQDYSARTSYRPPAPWYRRLNSLGVLLVSAGLAPRGVVVLEVMGRRSGTVRRVPLLQTRSGDHDHLVAIAGESQWVRNVRAAGGTATIRRHTARRVHLEELPVDQRPQVIRDYLEAGRRRGSDRTVENQARYYFGIEPDATLDDIRQIAQHYPVFRIEQVPDRAR